MKVDAVLIFESEKVEDLYPFSILHCPWELRIGALRLIEKIRTILPNAKIVYSGREDHIRSYLLRFGETDEPLEKENTLIIDASVLPNAKLFEEMDSKYREFTAEKGEKSCLFMSGIIPFAVYMTKEEVVNPVEFDKKFLPQLLSGFSFALPKADVANVKFINYLWDALDYLGEEIESDAELIDLEPVEPNNYPGVHFLNESRILVGKNVKIAPGAVLDAEEGTIILRDGARIMPQATIIGPAAIGENSLVKIGAKIYEDVSVGEICKVGGEIEASIIHAYSNKQHDGFLGHSYICEWVNLGADTNNSDLKNTYGEINMTLEDREIRTGKRFLGLFLGDHSKSAINSMFTTGTVAGICGILLGDGFMPRYIPSFSWGGKKKSPLYKVSKAIDVAKTVMDRRNKTLLPEEEKLILAEFERAKKKFG